MSYIGENKGSFKVNFNHQRDTRVGLSDTY